MTVGTPGATLLVEHEPGGRLTLRLGGRMDGAGTALIWAKGENAVRKATPAELVLDLGGVVYADGAGMGFVVQLRRLQRQRGGAFRTEGLSEDLAPLLAMYPAEAFDIQPPTRDRVHPVVEVGRVTHELLVDMKELLTFIGESVASLAALAIRPTKLRWKDTFRIIESAGVNATPILALVGFLIGLILAFQSAVPMKRFGAELYVADLVAISTIRELGPLLTAIILAGRSGSAFAAEIGTMKVNEEIDALTTLGLSPVRFLVVPRLLAAMFVTPLLALFTNLLALVGAGVVVMSFGYPLITFANRVTASITVVDVGVGLAKALVFGLIVAGIGCLRGLQTGAGALSVGVSTTRAVVAGIIMVIFTDGIFSVLLYVLGI